MWLGTHGMELGAVSVMLYCFRERELLLNINELLAGFRMFPSYMRIGGLREDLPRGFHDAVRSFLERLPEKLDEYEDLLTKNEIYLKRTQGVGIISKETAVALGLVGPIARAAGVDYDVRKAFPYLGYETYDFAVPTQTRGDVYSRYQVRIAEMRESLKLCRQALDRITPTGVFAIDDPRITPPPKDRVYTEMEALIQHFLIYSQGFTVPAGEAYVPVEGPRGEQGFYVVSDGTQPPVAHQVASAVAAGVSGAAANGGRRADRRRHRRHRIAGRHHGRRGPVSFHPKMAYGATFHKSSRAARGRRSAVRLHPGEPGSLRRDRQAVSG